MVGSKYGTSGKCFLVDQGGSEPSWSTTQHHGPASAPAPLRVHLDPTWSTSCNHTPEIADQGGSRWTRRTTGIMELGVGPGARWSTFYILLMHSQTNASVIIFSLNYLRSGQLPKGSGPFQCDRVCNFCATYFRTTLRCNCSNS